MPVNFASPLPLKPSTPSTPRTRISGARLETRILLRNNVDEQARVPSSSPRPRIPDAKLKTPTWCRDNIASSREQAQEGGWQGWRRGRSRGEDERRLRCGTEMCTGMVCTFCWLHLTCTYTSTAYSQSHPKAQPGHDGAPTVNTRLYLKTMYRHPASTHWMMAITNIRTSASSSASNQSLLAIFGTGEMLSMK